MGDRDSKPRAMSADSITRRFGKLELALERQRSASQLAVQKLSIDLGALTTKVSGVESTVDDIKNEISNRSKADETHQKKLLDKLDKQTAALQGLKNMPVPHVGSGEVSVPSQDSLTTKLALRAVEVAVIGFMGTVGMFALVFVLKFVPGAKDIVLAAMKVLTT